MWPCYVFWPLDNAIHVILTISLSFKNLFPTRCHFFARSFDYVTVASTMLTKSYIYIYILTPSFLDRSSQFLHLIVFVSVSWPFACLGPLYCTIISMIHGAQNVIRRSCRKYWRDGSGWLQGGVVGGGGGFFSRFYFPHCSFWGSWGISESVSDSCCGL